MDKPTLTIEQLKNYLGAGLKIDRVWIHAYGGFDGEELDLSVLYHCRISEIKPHCYRLSDLDKFIPELGFVPLVEFADRFKNPRKHELKWYTNSMGIKQDFKAVCTKTGNEVVFDHRTKMFKFYDGGCANWFTLIQQSQLFQWHFWPFGDEYFDAGLVIDKVKEVGNE